MELLEQANPWALKMIVEAGRRCLWHYRCTLLGGNANFRSTPQPLPHARSLSPTQRCVPHGRTGSSHSLPDWLKAGRAGTSDGFLDALGLCQANLLDELNIF